MSQPSGGRIALTAKAFLLASGHYRRRLASESFPGVAVLCYHAVRPDRLPAGRMVFEDLHVREAELEAHCAFFRSCCDPISLDDWRQADAGGPPLPPRPVLVTFDDGYRSTWTLARPILRRHRIPAVFFVPSHTIERRQLAWYDAVALKYGEARVAQMKELDVDAWSAACAEATRPASDEDPHAPLETDQIKALSDTPGFEIGGHTASHLLLARASLERQRHEVAENKARIESWIGRTISSFAYPNGRLNIDYTRETMDIVRACGLGVAFATNERFATRDESPLDRSRFVMLSGLSAAELAHRLSYSWRRTARA